MLFGSSCKSSKSPQKLCFLREGPEESLLRGLRSSLSTPQPTQWERRRKGGDAIPTRRCWGHLEHIEPESWAARPVPSYLGTALQKTFPYNSKLKTLPRTTIKPVRKQKKKGHRMRGTSPMCVVFFFPQWFSFFLFFFFPKGRQSWWTTDSLLLSFANKRNRIPVHISAFQTHCELYGPCSSSIHRANVPGVIHKPCHSVPKCAPLSRLI